jgi:3-oxoacyl-[acyl-carrier protein] reductase
MRTAFITGSSRGIGQAIALDLAKAGYRILLHAKTPSQKLAETELAIKQIGAPVKTFCFDLLNQSAIESTAVAMLTEFDQIDILVNNAAISQDASLLKMTWEAWDQVIQADLYGPFHLTKALLPAMKKNQFGRIINFSSIAAEKGAFGKANYAAAKAGLIGFTKSLAWEVGKYKITANAICPGWIDTDMTRSIPEKYRHEALSQIAMGRLGQPAEVAGLVTFLASEASSYITGAVIDVNGGCL